MSANAESATGIGLAAFDSLNAEQEPWLDRCLVLPPYFGLIAGAHSYLVVGGDGSGKTALFRALCAQLDDPPDGSDAPDRLVVHWRPRPVAPELVADQAAEAQLGTVISECADTLLGYLARWPAGFQDAPPDVQATLAWILCRSLGTGIDRRVSYHMRRASPAGAGVLRSLPSLVVEDEWLARAGPGELVAELVRAVRAIGPQAIYVLVGPDGLGDSPYLRRDLAAFLSSLTLFETPNLIYKIVLSDRLFQQLDPVMAVDRQRIRLAILHWKADELAEIVVRRARLATGQPVASLVDLCAYPNLGTWLERTGAESPRGWLEMVTPLVLRYLHIKRPVPVEEWRVIREEPPPALRFEPATGVITVGWRRITDVTDIPLALFTHLYKHRDRPCSREDLYYQAYLPAAQPSARSGEVPQRKRDHLLDSAMSRLRQSIEPDPRDPLYLITDRGFGYMLTNVV